jgi:hypothetical protein
MKAHPYALLLPALTDEEYAALKADIAVHGILYPVITDEDGAVLDGVHRVRIADELGIEPPVSQMGHLDEERKLHLAVGLNMRRRHLDAERRRELVRRLHEEQGLSVRQLAEVTGWSKSTMARDLETSPFEQVMRECEQAAEQVRKAMEEKPESVLLEVVGTVLDGMGGLHRFADGEWKRGQWPTDPVTHWHMTMTFYSLALPMSALIEMVGTIEAKSNKKERERVRELWDERLHRLDRLRDYWEQKDPDERLAWATRLQQENALRPRVPDGTATNDGKDEPDA